MLRSDQSLTRSLLIGAIVCSAPALVQLQQRRAPPGTKLTDEQIKFTIRP